MTKTAKTQEFLRMIAARLTGRPDCQKIEFIVGIAKRCPGSDLILPEDASVENYIFFSPRLNIYIDNHHRRDIDLEASVTDHIINRYYPHLVKGHDSMGNLMIDTSVFAPGIYQYQMSANETKRRWVRWPDYVDDVDRSRPFKKPIKFGI